MNTPQQKAAMVIANRIKKTGVVELPPQIAELLRLAKEGDASKKLIGRISALKTHEPKYKVRIAAKALIDLLKSEGGAMGRKDRVALTGSAKPINIQLAKLSKKARAKRT